MARILIVEDEKGISNLIYLNLQVAGYESIQAFNGKEVLPILETQEVDLILLDVMLPDIDGFQLMDLIRPMGIPVIFLTARDGLTDKIQGLKMGAEDYIVKPFEAMELLARIEVVLRRYSSNKSLLVFEDLEINEEQRQVKKAGKTIDLAMKEYELLLLLVRNRNKALSREKILECIWGYDYFGETRTVDIHIQKLRKKLDWSEKIKTVYKFGYRLEN
jgi:two-component system, OmpR family, alkaline phosphatase synthesis response regulator PhoP